MTACGFVDGDHWVGPIHHGQSESMGNMASEQGCDRGLSFVKERYVNYGETTSLASDLSMASGL